MSFQKTEASNPKFVPFTVMVKGGLLTGTLFGESSMSAGGEKLVPNIVCGP